MTYVGYIVLAVLALIALAALALAYWAAGLLRHGRQRPLTCTPRDYGLPYEDVTFQSKDGVELRG